MQHVLVVDELVVQRGSTCRVALPHLELAGGDCAVLHGPSGCGKSTLLAGLLGVEPDLVTRGKVQLGGMPLLPLAADQQRQCRRQHSAFLLQGARMALDPLHTIDRQLVDGALATSEQRNACLRDLGLPNPARIRAAYANQLSGGEAQRVLLALALLRSPALVVVDEPSADLDAASRAQVLAGLQRLRDQGSALLLASHDHAFVRELGGVALACRDGAFVPGALLATPWPNWGARSVGGAVLTARGLTAKVAQRVLFSNLSFTLRAGEAMALLGPSGSGKTTLARILAGFQRPAAGEVTCTRKGGVQLVCQDAKASLTPTRSLAQMARETGAPATALQSLASELGLAPALLTRPAQFLSGGEARRAALARAILARPDVLLLDEPTHGLDRASAQQVLAAVERRCSAQRSAVLLITHDQELAASLGGSTLQLPVPREESAAPTSPTST